MPDAPADGRPAQGGPEILDTQLVQPTVLAAAGGARFTAGGLLSRTLRVWWAHVAAFTAMSVAAYAPMLAGIGVLFGWAVGGVEPGRAPEPSELATRGVLAVAGMGASVVLSVVQMGAVTYGTVRHLHGEPAPFGRMIAVGLRRGLPVVGTGIVVWLVTLAGFLLLFVPGVLFLVAAAVAVPAAVVERPGVFGAIGRSFELTRGSRWPLFAAGLAVVAAVWALSGVVQVALSVLASAALPPAPAMAVTLVGSQLGSALFSVVPVVAVAVAYHDLRRAKEGVDTAELARVFE